MSQDKIIENKHIYELDYMRAVSAVLVMLYHYTTQYQKSIGHIEVWPISISWAPGR